SPFDGVALEFVNPADGGHTFTTMACGAQMLRPGEITRTHRHKQHDLSRVPRRRRYDDRRQKIRMERRRLLRRAAVELAQSSERLKEGRGDSFFRQRSADAGSIEALP